MVKLGRWYKDKYNEYTMPLIVNMLNDKLIAIISLRDTALSILLA